MTEPSFKKRKYVNDEENLSYVLAPMLEHMMNSMYRELFKLSNKIDLISDKIDRLSSITHQVEKELADLQIHMLHGQGNYDEQPPYMHF